MAAFNKFNTFVLNLLNATINFNTGHVFKVMLTNVAPIAANAVKLDVTEITAGAGYTAGGTASAMTTSQAAGVGKVVGVNVVFTAAAGSIGPFRYAVLYNDTQTTPAKPLVGWWDYGSAVALADTETFTVAFDGTNGILTVT